MIHQIVVEVMSITEKKGKYSNMEAFVDTMLPLQACSLIAEGKNNLLFNGIISKTCQLYERKGTRGMHIFQVFDALNYWACQAAKIVNRQ